MKIAVLVEKFPPEKCEGLELATQNIARRLALRGHDVHVVTMLDQGKSRKSTEDGVHVNRFSIPRGYAGYAVMWLKTLLSVGRINADINHAQTVFMGIPALFAKLALNKPYVVWGRDDIYPPWRFKQLLSKLVLDNADGLIALTADMRKEMGKLSRRPIHVIPNGVDAHRFAPPESAYRRHARMRDRTRVILFVGGLRKIKGLDSLLRASSILKERGVNAKLALVGDGSERKHLEVLASDLRIVENVEFVGKVSPENVPEYMAAADVFVLPSMFEGFPNVLLEAMAAGLPIVATRVGGVPDIVADGVNGFIVEPGNPPEIAKKVAELLEDDALRTAMADNNKREAQKYSWDAVATQLERLYRSILD